MKIPFKSSKKPKPRSQSGSRGVSLERLWLTAFGGMVVAVVGLGVFQFQQFSAQQQAEEGQQSALIAGALAGQVAAATGHYAASLDYIVKDPGLAQLIVAGDAAAIQEKERGLAYLFPSFLRIRLLPPGLETPDNRMTPPLGYACLDLLHQAERDEAPAAEVHLPGSPQQHIDLARAIPGPNGRPVGVLLVSLSVPVLQQAMNRLQVGEGYVELRQSGGGQPIVLATRGTRPEAAGTPAQTVALAGAGWQLAYWPPAAAGDSGAVQIWYWGAFGLAVLFLGALFLMLYRAMAGALRQDQVTVIKLVRDVSDGAQGRGYASRLANNQGMIEQLQHMLRDLSGKPAAKAEAVSSVIDDPFGGLGGESEVEVEEVSELPGPPASIFRAYDIRGVVTDALTPEVVYDIGRAIGSEAYDRGQQKVVVARDGRLSGPDLSNALARGLMAAGRDVIDVGRVPTPVLYFATQYLGSGSGVMVTGSHNPPEYNGLKIMLRGETLHDESIQALRNRIETGNFFAGEGGTQSVDVVPSYIDRITSDVRLGRPLKVVVDCGNGVTGEIAPALLRALGCDVVELFCEIDGNFPNHHPDPGKPENLVALARAVPEHGADLGVAFDGDGDRLGVVDSEGKIIWPDRLLMLLAMDVLLRQPGAQIIYDVKCSRHLERVITEHGGQPLMSKTGHSFIKAKIQETGAQLAGEMSGHIFFKERWFGFDDALYACARLLEILSGDDRSSKEIFGSLPESVSTPELNVSMAEGEHFQLMQRLIANAQFGGARLITIDGLRAEFEDGWGLVRASNTTPCLVLRFEAEDAEGLRRIQDEFRKQLLALDPGLQLPF